MNTSVKDVKNFIHFAAKELQLSSLPKISLVGSKENSKNAFGHFLGSRNGTFISVRITDRHPIDVMRTIAHELIHYKQRISGVRSSEQMKEDEANALAGRIMRKYDTTHPGTFKDKPIREETASAVPANAMGASSSTSGPIVTIDPLMMKKPLSRIVKTKKLKDIEESGNGIFHKKTLFADAGHKKKPMKDRFSGKTDFNKMMKDEDGEEKNDYTMGKKIRVGQ
jgi:hypothetical protein